MFRAGAVDLSPMTLLGAATGVLVVITLAAAGGVISAIVIEQTSPSIDALLASTTLAVAAYPIVKRIATSSFDILEPIVGASVMLAILFGVRPLAMMIADDMLSYRGYDIEPYFTMVLLLGLLGTTAFVVGYEVVNRAGPKEESPHRREMPYVHLSTVYMYAIVASALGVVLFAVHLSLGGSIFETLRLMASGVSAPVASVYGRSSEYLSAAPVLVVCAAIIVVVAAGRRLSKVELLLVLLAIAYAVGCFFLVGARRFIIPSAAIPVVAYYLTLQRPPPAKLVVLIVPLAFIVLSTIPYGRTAGAREQAGGLVPILRDAFAAPVDSWKRFITGADTEMVSALAREVEVLSEPSDYAYGMATLGDVALAPIPSAVFPGKPTTAKDEMRTKAFGGPCRAFGGLCANFSVIGTFYQDFWYPGVAVGMALLGAGSAWVWRRYVSARHDPFAVVLAASWAVFLPILIRAGFMPSFAWFLYFLLPSLLGLRLATWSKPADTGAALEHYDAGA